MKNDILTYTTVTRHPAVYRGKNNKTPQRTKYKKATQSILGSRSFCGLVDE